MVVRPDSGINSIADLKDKKVASHGSHPGLNDWLLLKQRGLDCDLEQVEIVWKKDLKQDTDAKHRRNDHTPLWHLVRDRQVDAVFLQETPVSLFAEDAGLKVIDVEPLPMIWFTTISSSLSFVRKHPDLVDRFLKGIIDGIHFFKTEPEKSIKIIQDRFVEEDELNLAQATYVYQQLAPLLEPRLLPSMAAISNVYEEAKRIDEDAKKINPLALWDLHHIRHLDDSGVIDALYASKPEPAASETVYPDYQAEKAKRQTQIIEAVKACGHPLHKACGCEDD
jgi:ABC-type nitrate/sulfonate/bicarbonate transport system substrate-binding protein